MDVGMSGYVRKEDMPPATQEARDPIVIDIGLAMKQLDDNPELCRMMNELVVGKVVADQLAAADELVTTLLTGLQAIVDRSSNGESGTSKVIDMRNIASSLLALHGGTK